MADLTSVPDDDAEFLRAVEAVEVPIDLWNHRAHIRLAYCYLTRYPFEEALRRAKATIMAPNVKYKVPTDLLERGYHETMTIAWMRVVAATIRTQGAGANSLDFCEKQPHLCQRTLLRLYYTKDRIMNWDAKRRWVEPDIAPLP